MTNFGRHSTKTEKVTSLLLLLYLTLVDFNNKYEGRPRKLWSSAELHARIKQISDVTVLCSHPFFTPVYIWSSGVFFFLSFNFDSTSTGMSSLSQKSSTYIRMTTSKQNQNKIKIPIRNNITRWNFLLVAGKNSLCCALLQHSRSSDSVLKLFSSVIERYTLIWAQSHNKASISA